jgi:hypothetical protein
MTSKVWNHSGFRNVVTKFTSHTAQKAQSQKNDILLTLRVWNQNIFTAFYNRSIIAKKVYLLLWFLKVHHLKMAQVCRNMSG